MKSASVVSDEKEKRKKLTTKMSKLSFKNFNTQTLKSARTALTDSNQAPLASTRATDFEVVSSV